MATSANPFKTRIVTREYYVAFGLVTSLFFLWGFCYGLLDVLNSHFQKVRSLFSSRFRSYLAYTG